MFGGDSWYMKGFGGATFPQDDDFELDLRGGGGSVDTGLEYRHRLYARVRGAASSVTPNVAVELEYAYRNADAELKDSGGDSGKTKSNAFMVNALYKFTPHRRERAVAALRRRRASARPTSTSRASTLVGGDLDSDYNFAYQVIGGVGYAVNPNLSLIGELRFFGINDQDFENDVLSFKSTYHTIDLLFGATYSF